MEENLIIFRRLLQFVDYKQLSQNKFAQTIGETSAQMTNMFKKNKNVGLNMFVKVFNTYPELSIEWIFRGKGEMILSNKPVKYATDEAYAELKAAEVKTQPLYKIEIPEALQPEGGNKDLLQMELDYLKRELALKDKIIELLSENKK